MGIRAKVEGRAKVTARLRQLVPDAEEAAAKAQLEAAEDLAGAVRARAPVLTGEYRASIRAGRLADTPTRKPVGITATKDPNATGLFALYIWKFIEFGVRPHSMAKGADLSRGKGQGGARQHPGMRPQPHVFPTYRALRRRIRRKVAGAINRAVRKAQGR